MPDAPKLFYNIKEAAAAVGVNPMTIRRAIDSGALTATYPTARPLIKVEELERWGSTDRKSA